MDQTPPLPTEPQAQNPNPPAQQTTPQTTQQQTQPQKSNNKQIWIIVGLAACLPMLIIGGILATMVITSLGSAHEKAKDAAIKGQLSSVGAIASVYYDKNSTLIGFDKSPEIINIQSSVKQYNSELIFQTITKDNFVGYAKLPSSGKVFCVGPISANESSTGTCTPGEGMELNNTAPAPTFPPLGQ